jgi:hypothetical protein
MCETIPNYDEKVCCPRESNWKMSWRNKYMYWWRHTVTK